MKNRVVITKPTTEVLFLFCNSAFTGLLIAGFWAIVGISTVSVCGAGVGKGGSEVGIGRFTATSMVLCMVGGILLKVYHGLIALHKAGSGCDVGNLTTIAAIYTHYVIRDF